MNVSTLEQIINELTEIQKVIEVEMSEEVHEAIDRGNYCNAMLARTGKLLADAKIHRDQKFNSQIMDNVRQLSSLSASTANKMIDSLCFEENYLVNWSERVNRSCTHQLDWCRTLISKAKTEMNQFNR